MKGTETVRALRAKGVKSAICGLSANDTREAFLSAGADMFHLKPLPCGESDLQKVLGELVALRKSDDRKPSDAYSGDIVLAAQVSSFSGNSSPICQQQ